MSKKKIPIINWQVISGIVKVFFIGEDGRLSNFNLQDFESIGQIDKDKSIIKIKSPVIGEANFISLESAATLTSRVESVSKEQEFL